MELFDECLKDLMGDRYDDGEKPPIAEYEPCEAVQEPAISLIYRIMNAAKWPTFFLALCCFIGWTASAELMDVVIAVPGMCVCSACFGWHVHK